MKFIINLLAMFPMFSTTFVGLYLLCLAVNSPSLVIPAIGLFLASFIQGKNFDKTVKAISEFFITLIKEE